MKLDKTHNKLSQNIRGQSVDLLNEHLVAAIDLHAQMKLAHWNVRGLAFIAVHELFDKVAAEVEDFSDLIAERTRALGGIAKGGVKLSAEKSFLTPYPIEVADEKSHIEWASKALSAFGDSVRKAISAAEEADDPVTADLFTEITRRLDQQLWFVESHATSH